MTEAAELVVEPGAAYWPMVTISRRTAYLATASRRIMRAQAAAAHKLLTGESAMLKQLAKLRANADRDEGRRLGLPVLTDAQAQRLGVERYVVQREMPEGMRQAPRMSFRIG